MKIFVASALTGILFLLLSCDQDYVPKPRGYFRIDFPEKSYRVYEKDCPYRFEYPAYALIDDYNKDSCWINILYPDFNAIIYITYKDVNHNLDSYIEESNRFVYKHTVKADAIDDTIIQRPDARVNAMLFFIKGNAASSVNFYATDSTEHFIRGALYFNVLPNKDSLAPVVEFITGDIRHLINTLEWKKTE